MKVVEVGHETSLARITSDDRVGKILDVIRRHGELLSLVLSVIRRFHTEEELRDGRGGPANLRSFIELQTRGSSRSSRRAAEELAKALEGLYRDEEEGNVRGALLEALVEDRLRARYHTSGCLLTNNLRFELAEGGKTVYSSNKASIDVIGFDGKRGECHDCKVNSRQFEKWWIEELEQEVQPHGFRIGLATCDYADKARRNLQNNHIQLQSAQLLDAKSLFGLLPLQLEPARG